MRALISVSNKAGLVEFARGLVQRGWDIVSTGGTARALADAGVPVVQVAEVTGAPEMMDGRVKTLHPMIHGGILARRDHASDREAMERFRITPIDMVVVNLYPFCETAARPGTAFEALVEDIDIGGPSMIRAAAKNFKDVLVVTSPGDYGRVLAALDEPGGPSMELRFALAKEAFTHTGSYDCAIANELEAVAVEGGACRRLAERDPLPPRLIVATNRHRTLRYGENPHQPGAWYVPADVAPGDLPAVLQGKELSFTNLLDVDAASRIAAEFVEPAAVVIKHTNPCGAATGLDLAEAYVRARDADPLSAFGGIVGCNREVDEATAQAIASTFIEAVIAPAITEAALAVLAARKNLRVVIAPAAFGAGGVSRTLGRLDLRSALGGILAQDADRVAEARDEWPREGGPEVVTRRAPTPAEWKALRFAWRVCAHVKSNTVIFTSEDRTLAVGAGQMSRVDAVNVARMKAEAAKLSLAGSVAASDAFFPFRDGLDAIVAAGATAVVQPGGSVRDADVIAAADEHGIAMVLTRRRHFRH
ncbi:MAG TPA: bifunctional phosphoribosylaminoimidazolecarboxamide formyltransferase/IMP cyclohydrolase [Vicinamibacterales bacterium]|nr:bifunctional phosphoribosylaminoimidazolecarboxamide formyltransferase/IMP cyclohydrolase [Vicinamibacterales bacterium]HOQ59883.1 bifunctional phosphoribosylaminoimidazolecarboxamide formyltransferase/IMP cyclohydrolase [Vicinamibacterales bacterium]